MKRLLRLGVLFILLLEMSAVFAHAVSFSAQTEGACRPGKTVAITVSVNDPGNTAAFLVTAESDAMTFVRAEALGAAKAGYTRSYGTGGSGSFVYTAKNGAAGFSGEAVEFIFRAPETPGTYAVTVTVSQVAGADGAMTDAVYSETLSISVGEKAPDTPDAEEYSSMTEESSEETLPESTDDVESSSAGEEEIASSSEASAPSAVAAPEKTPDVLAALPAGEQHSFLLGMGAAAMVFALGIGVYVLLARHKEPPKDDK